MASRPRPQTAQRLVELLERQMLSAENQRLDRAVLRVGERGQMPPPTGWFRPDLRRMNDQNAAPNEDVPDDGSPATLDSRWR